MDFGKVFSLQDIAFALPPDHADTARVLGGTATPSASRRAFVGCPVWTTREWVGKWYPATARDKDLLHHYARQFNTIELNTTHYRIPDAATVARWCAATEPGFAFCPKWPQQISHEAELRHVDQPVRLFAEAVLSFGDRLGVSFLQLPPAYSPGRRDTLHQFVDELPQKVPLAVEFRHAGWFTGRPDAADTLNRLEAAGVGTVITDVAGRRDVLHMHLTTRTATIRFVGNGLHPTDYQRIDDWVARLERWFSIGLEKVYFFIHEPDPNTLAPDLCRYLVQQVNEACGLHLPEPVPVPQVVQGSLF